MEPQRKKRRLCLNKPSLCIFPQDILSKIYEYYIYDDETTRDDIIQDLYCMKLINSARQTDEKSYEILKAKIRGSRYDECYQKSLKLSKISLFFDYTCKRDMNILNAMLREVAFIGTEWLRMKVYADNQKIWIYTNLRATRFKMKYERIKLREIRDYDHETKTCTVTYKLVYE